MKILTTSDWHIGNLFHGNDRLPEHKHFLNWLLAQIEERQPDALLVAGDVFDVSNPSAAAQSAYYAFLADATRACPGMQMVLTAGNHDSAGRLEAPRALLARHRVEVRGTLRRSWVQRDGGAGWEIDYDDLMIPVESKDGEAAVILAVPYLRNDTVQDADYSAGVNRILGELTRRAREKYPDAPLVMMAHMYASGAEIAQKDASEKIVIGGQEEVNMEGWTDHPDYLVCGHIHKRQPVRDTDWARYTGSVLPMSFAETDYRHGVDLVTVSPGRKPGVEFLEYVPQHKLCMLPAGPEAMTSGELQKLIRQELADRGPDGQLDDHFVYLALKVKMEDARSDERGKLESLVSKKNAVLCKIEKVVPLAEARTLAGDQTLKSIEDIISRDPLDTLRETFAVRHNKEMSPRQEQMLRDLLASVRQE